MSALATPLVQLQVRYVGIAPITHHDAVTNERPEVFVSVDVEASGQSPSNGSLLSIGACLVDDPSVALYLELKPLPDREWDTGAERVHGLTREHLETSGLDAADAMVQFETWLRDRCCRRLAPDIRRLQRAVRLDVRG